MRDEASFKSRQLGSEGLGLKINNDIFIPRVESVDEKQSFIRNLISKIDGGVCGRKGADQFGKNKLFL